MRETIFSTPLPTQNKSYAKMRNGATVLCSVLFCSVLFVLFCSVLFVTRARNRIRHRREGKVYLVQDWDLRAEVPVCRVALSKTKQREERVRSDHPPRMRWCVPCTQRSSQFPDRIDTKKKKNVVRMGRSSSQTNPWLPSTPGESRRRQRSRPQ